MEECWLPRSQGCQKSFFDSLKRLLLRWEPFCCSDTKNDISDAEMYNSDAKMYFSDKNALLCEKDCYNKIRKGNIAFGLI